MKKKTAHAKPKQKRARLDGLIAAAPTTREKMQLAFYGVTAPERNQLSVRIAKAFWFLKETANDKFSDKPKAAMLVDGEPVEIDTAATMREKRFQDAKTDLEFFSLVALNSWTPKMFEDLAKAMRRVERGEFDCQFGNTDPGAMARAAIIHDPKANIAKVAAEFFPKQEISHAERNLRRIKARILPRKKGKTHVRKGRTNKR